MTDLVVLVDRTAADGAMPTALLPWSGGTVLNTLLAQTAALGLGKALVLTGDDWYRDVVASVGSGARVISHHGVRGTFLALANCLESTTGSVALVHGDVVAHTSALGSVLDHPLVTTGLLSSPTPHGASLRTCDGLVVSAGSSAHEVTSPDQAHLGVLRIDSGDRAAAAAVAREAARLADSPGWDGADPIEVLTVGLVRRGVPVRAVPLSDYRWARPASRHEAETAAAVLASVDERRVRLRGAARPDDGFYSTFVVRKVSQHVTAWALPKGFTPNQVTLASLLIGLLAAVLFALGSRWTLVAGAVLLQAALVADCVDGEIARYRRRFTPMGAWLDGVSDRFKEYAAYAGLAIGAARNGDELWTLAAATLALQVFRHTVDFGFMARPAGGRERPPQVRLPLGRPSDAPDDPDTEGPAPTGMSGRLGHQAIRLSERSSRTSALVWAKRVVIMPIGERWLVISVTAALLSPRATFVTLLVLGGIAAAYTTTGRVLRAVADAETGAVSRRASAGGLDHLLDAGPLARAIGKGLAGSMSPTLQAPAVVTATVLVSAALLAAEAADPGVLAAAAVLFAVVTGAAWAVPLEERMAWLYPAVMRAAEYAFVVRVVAVLQPDALPAAYAYLLVVAYHHYDTVYRLRHTGAAPAGWATTAAGGYDGRMLALALLAVAGFLEQGLWLLTVGMGLVVVGESVAAWTRWLRLQARRRAGAQEGGRVLSHDQTDV